MPCDGHVSAYGAFKQQMQPLHTPHQTLLDELEARQEEVLRQLEELEERIRRTLQACAAETARCCESPTRGS